jgi:hypothetical protein
MKSGTAKNPSPPKRRCGRRIWLVALLLHAWLPVARALQLPPGWSKSGNPTSFDMGVDRAVMFEGKPSGYIKSISSNPRGFGMLFQKFSAAGYQGKRARFSAVVKSQNVEDWAGLMMSVIVEEATVASDSMQKRPIRGTQDWTVHSVVLDVDSRADNISIGFKLTGKGAVWINDVQFGEVGADVPVTNTILSSLPRGGMVPVSDWMRGGSNWSEYDMSTASPVAFKGKPSISIKSNHPNPEGNGSYMQVFDAETMRGKRISFSAFIKSENVEKSSGLCIDVLARSQEPPLNIQCSEIKGTQPWTRSSVVLDIDPAATQMQISIELNGSGALWISDVQLEKAGSDVAVTKGMGRGLLTHVDPMDVKGWVKTSSNNPNEYGAGIDPGFAVNGKYGGYIKSNISNPQGSSTFYQMIAATNFRGKRMRFSAAVMSENVKKQASLWMRVDSRENALAFDNMQNRPIKGTRAWTRYSVVLHVDPHAARITFGIQLTGSGAVWIDDARLEEVGSDVAITDMMKPPSGPRNLGFDEGEP